MRFFATVVLVAGMLGLLFVAAYLSVSNSPTGVETTEASTGATTATTQTDDGEILSVGAVKLDSFLKESDEPLLIDFWASWCGPCRLQDGILESLSDEYAGHVTFLRVDVDENRDLAARFEVEALPTMIVLSEGRVVDRFSGVTRARELRDSFQRAGISEGDDSHQSVATSVTSASGS